MAERPPRRVQVKNSHELAEKLVEAEKQVEQGKYLSWDEVKKKLDAQAKLWEKPHYKYLISPFWRVVFYIKETPMRVKRFWQRGCRGYADIDAWNFCDYISGVISGATKWLAANNNGYPEDIYQSSDRDDEKASKVWSEILMKISNGFSLKLKYIDDPGNPTQKELDDVKEALELFVKYFDSLWD
jgi:hypothetical protein